MQLRQLTRNAPEELFAGLSTDQHEEAKKLVDELGNRLWASLHRMAATSSPRRIGARL